MKWIELVLVAVFGFSVALWFSEALVAQDCVYSPRGRTTTHCIIPEVPAEETIAAAATITADACGSIKLITTDDLGAVTTGTTNTFTAPAAANEGCIMLVCNSGGTDNITLDDNALFSAGGDVALTPEDCTTVASTGAIWYQITALEAN